MYIIRVYAYRLCLLYVPVDSFNKLIIKKNKKFRDIFATQLEKQPYVEITDGTGFNSTVGFKVRTLVLEINHPVQWFG